MSRSEWKPATPSRRCKVCKSPKRCAISDDGAVAKCTYVFDGPNVFKGGDDEVGQWAMHRLDGSTPAEAAARRKDRVDEPDPMLADAATRDQVYRALLAACPLTAEHREGLMKRGLSADEIAARGYGSLPLGAGPRARIVAQVRGILGAETIPEGVPGLHAGQLPEGITGTLVPVRDVAGAIVAMKVRRDGAADPKYVWLSSKKVGGATPHSPAHVAMGSREAVEAARINSATGARPEVVVRITEGELKADVAFVLSGVPTICIPGAGAWRSALEPVRALAPDVLRLAWDADARANEHVAAALETAAIRYTQELPGVALELETWEPAAGKGVDDVLLAGAPTTLHRGVALWHEIVAILNAAGVDPRKETLAHAGVIAVPSVIDAHPQPGADADDAWTATLARGKRGAVTSSYGNVAKIVRHAPPFAGRLRLNTMTQEVEWNGATILESRIGEIREAIEDGPASWGGFAPTKGDVVDAVRADAETRSYHPVQEFFAQLPAWDGTPRVEGVATEVMGAPSDPLILAMMRRWFVSAVARALEPGCKVDTALVLLGEQGYKKSTFFAALAPKWFGDTEIKIGDKDGLQQIHHNWITEWAEIDRITSVRHAGEVKTFIARRRDCFRPPYGANTRNYDRSCVIVGSTNNDGFLSDPTGGRRFWVIPVTRKINMDYVERVRDQLWAEALHLYRAGEQWWLTDAEEGLHRRDVEQYRVRDPWEEIVARWIENAWPTECLKLGRSSFTTWDVMSLALKLDPKDARKETEGRVGAVMRALGYDRGRPSRSDVGEYLGKDGLPTQRPRVWVRRVEQGDQGAGPDGGAPDPGPGAEAQGTGGGGEGSGGGFVEGSASARQSSAAAFAYAPPVRASPAPMSFDDDFPPDDDLPFSTGAVGGAGDGGPAPHGVLQ